MYSEMKNQIVQRIEEVKDSSVPPLWIRKRKGKVRLESSRCEFGSTTVTT